MEKNYMTGSDHDPLDWMKYSPLKAFAFQLYIGENKGKCRAYVSLWHFAVWSPDVKMLQAEHEIYHNVTY